MMADTPFQAVRVVYEAIGGIVPTVGEQAWGGTIPEGTINSPPTVCYSELGSTKEYSKRGLSYETYSFRFDVFVVGKTACTALIKTLTDAYGYEALTIDSRRTVLFCRRDYVTKATQKGPKGEILFNGVAEFDAKINRLEG